MELGKVLSTGWHAATQAVPALDGLDKLTGGEIGKLVGAVGSDGDVGGVDPAKIHHWFYDGPGTSSYQGAQDVHRGLGKDYHDAANDVAAAKKALGGWHGKAADQAHGAIDKVTARFDAQSARSTDASSKIGSQVDTFGNTKHKVQQVPNTPPQGGSLLEHMNPVTLPGAVAGDAAVVNYQDKARANQEAYHSYGGATGPQGQGLPQAQLPPPDRHHDTHILVPPKPGGHDYGGHDDTTHDPGDVSRRHGPSAPGTTSTAGLTSSSSTPPSPHGGYQPTPTGSAGGPNVPGPGGGYGGGPYGGGAGGPYGRSGYTGASPGQGVGGFRPGGAGSAGFARGAGELGGFAPLAGGGIGRGGDTARGKNGSWSSRGRGRGGIARGGAAEEVIGGRSAGKAGSARGMAGKSGIGSEAGAARSARPGGAAAAEAAERAAMARGAAGKPGASAIPPGAAGRGKKDEDDEHTAADYLQNNNFHDEVIGSIEKTVPPVIGEFDPTEQ